MTEIELLRLMLTAREGDLREAILMRQGKGWLQVPSMGHEALAALGDLLEPGDLLFPYYRDRPLMLARGLTPAQIAADFFANAESSSAGRNMPMHCTSRQLGIFSPATPTAAQCLPAVGAAWGLRLSGKENIVLCTIGDAATREGEFYEAVCFAVQENLPIVFLVEDNAYGISTPTARMLPFRLDIFDSKLVRKVNGLDVEALRQEGQVAFTSAREGHGPVILWCELDRMGSHTNSDDHRVYRSAEDIAAMRERDPIDAFAKKLIQRKLLRDETWQEMRSLIPLAVDKVYRQAEEKTLPDEAAVMREVLGKMRSGTRTSARDISAPETGAGHTTIVATVNAVFRELLGNDSRVLFFGQDIEDPKGGVFGFTKGLSTDYPGRVMNAPLAEATIVGAGVGLAATGFRPIFEIQFIDFLTPAFHQLVTQAANLRWRTNGDWTCPLILYAPYGAYLPGGGIWHSQSNEGWWTHIPGLRVAVPSTPWDVRDVFFAAMECEDTSLILLPKHLARERFESSAGPPLGFGKARVRREGHDVTLVTWGNGPELALQAAESLQPEGIEVEVIDLRSLVPADWEAIRQSLEKTGRLVVLQEDKRTSSFGQAVISEMTSRPECFNLLLSAPQLVTREDVYIPFAPSLEYAVLPDLHRLMTAIYTTME